MVFASTHLLGWNYVGYIRIARWISCIQALWIYECQKGAEKMSSNPKTNQSHFLEILTR